MVPWGPRNTSTRSRSKIVALRPIARCKVNPSMLRETAGSPISVVSRLEMPRMVMILVAFEVAKLTLGAIAARSERLPLPCKRLHGLGLKYLGAKQFATPPTPVVGGSRVVKSFQCAPEPGQEPTAG